VLKERVLTERDEKYGPATNELFISAGTAKLLKEFWEIVEDNLVDCSEFCIDGPSGSGKSCAAQILAGDIRRKLPDAHVYHFRRWQYTDSEKDGILLAVKQSAKSVTTYFMIDQVPNDDVAQDLGGFADLVNLNVVLISSANLQVYFGY
jgi:hypothetical protein